MKFNDGQIERYSRHLVMEEIGGAGQARLLAAKVLIIGAGGLGSPVAFYLAAAGVGQIGLVDSDQVELSNLQRQILHTTQTIGVPKVASAKETINRLNPDIQVDCYHVRCDHRNILNLIEPYDVVVDAVDHFPTKFLINDACVLAQKPLVHGGVLRFVGQLFVRQSGTGCLRCLFPSVPPEQEIPNCAAAGVFAPQVGVIGTLQAMEVCKLILGNAEPLVNRVLSYDGQRAVFKTIRFTRNPDCPVCGDHPVIITPNPVDALNCQVVP